MQRVSGLLASWDRRRSGSKDLTSLNRLSAPPPKVRKEAFWPVALDSECEKAARILKTFCADGCLAPLDDEPATAASEPKTPIRVTKRIPKRIIQNAAGIAVFTCMRSGLWMTGSGGSGILIARKADGTWSPPSALLLHTPTLSFIIGVDIYDCVLIINNLAALESLTRPSVTLGEDVGLTCGPMVTMESSETDVRWRDLGNTVFTYLKARGQSQKVNLHGCILTERSNENERFYTGDLSAMDILAGNVSRSVDETQPLFEVIKQAEGRTDFDQSIIDRISIQPAPGDAMIESPKSTPVSPKGFGIPDPQDPDPFGVLALEMAGLEIREAGTRRRPASGQFEYNPSPASPINPKFQRQSVDTYMSKSNRGSYMSARTEKTHTTDACTQTDVPNTPVTTPSSNRSEDGRGRASFDNDGILRDGEVDYTKIDFSPLRQLSACHSIDGTTMIDSAASTDDDHARADHERHSTTTDLPTPESIPEAADEDGDADDEDDEEDEPVVFEVVASVQPQRNSAIASQVIQAKGSLVNIPKRIPPPLPVRSPARVSRSSKSDIGDVSMLRSPLRLSFNEDGQDITTTTGNSTVEEPATVECVEVPTAGVDEPKVTGEPRALPESRGDVDCSRPAGDNPGRAPASGSEASLAQAVKGVASTEHALEPKTSVEDRVLVDPEIVETEPHVITAATTPISVA